MENEHLVFHSHKRATPQNRQTSEATTLWEEKNMNREPKPIGPRRALPVSTHTHTHHDPSILHQGLGTTTNQRSSKKALDGLMSSLRESTYPPTIGYHEKPTSAESSRQLPSLVSPLPALMLATSCAISPMPGENRGTKVVWSMPMPRVFDWDDGIGGFCGRCCQRPTAERISGPQKRMSRAPKNEDLNEPMTCNSG